MSAKSKGLSRTQLDALVNLYFHRHHGSVWQTLRSLRKLGHVAEHHAKLTRSGWRAAHAWVAEHLHASECMPLSECPLSQSHPFTLAQIQDVFAREIAGNHTVLGIDRDGWEICVCHNVEIDGERGTVYFTMLAQGDWCICTAEDASQMLSAAKDAERDARNATLVDVYDMPQDDPNVYRLSASKELGTKRTTCEIGECFPDDPASVDDALEQISATGRTWFGGGAAPLVLLVLSAKTDADIRQAMGDIESVGPDGASYISRAPKRPPHVPVVFFTNEFVRSHGKPPRGRGSWGFEFSTDQHKDLCGVWFAPGSLAYQHARALATKHAQELVSTMKLEGVARVAINVCP